MADELNVQLSAGEGNVADKLIMADNTLDGYTNALCDASVGGTDASGNDVTSTVNMGGKEFDLAGSAGGFIVGQLTNKVVTLATNLPQAELKRDELTKAINQKVG